MAMTTENLYTHLFCKYSYFTAAVELLLDLDVLAPGYSMARLLLTTKGSGKYYSQTRIYL
jgi:hypothetical protein